MWDFLLVCICVLVYVCVSVFVWFSFYSPSPNFTLVFWGGKESLSYQNNKCPDIKKREEYHFKFAIISWCYLAEAFGGGLYSRCTLGNPKDIFGRRVIQLFGVQTDSMGTWKNICTIRQLWQTYFLKFKSFSYLIKGTLSSKVFLGKVVEYVFFLHK